jgi:hypothetical protein
LILLGIIRLPGVGYAPHTELRTGSTNFSQQVQFDPKPDTRLLRRMIEAHFSGTRASVRDVELFMLEDTAFHAGHYKTSVLRKRF